jgi:hypothetical protein
MEGATGADPAILGISRATVREGMVTLARLTVAGLVAIGLSAMLAFGMGALAGASFVAGDPPGVTYTAERCRDLLEYAPRATSCEAAAAEHHFTETVLDRAAAGLLGLGLAAVVWLVTSRRPRRPELLPKGFEATIGATAFGLAAGGLLALGAEPMIAGGGKGAGQWLSAAAVAAVFAAGYALALLRVLRRPQASARPLA